MVQRTKFEEEKNQSFSFKKLRTVKIEVIDICDTVTDKKRDIHQCLVKKWSQVLQLASASSAKHVHRSRLVDTFN